MFKRVLLAAALAFLAPLAFAQNVPVPIGPTGGGTVANPLSGQAGGTGVANTGKTLTLQGNYTLGGTTGSTLNMGAGGTLGYFAFGTDASRLTGTLPAASLVMVPGTAFVTSGIDKGLLYDNNGRLGNLATGNNGVLTTNSSGTPSIGTRTSYVLENSGYSTLNAAVAGIGSTPAELVIGSNYTLTASLTIPSTLKLTILNGGSITKASTYTLTINGQFQAPPKSYVFVGFASGDVTFASGATPTFYAEWWGASTGGTGNEIPINKAFVAAGAVAGSVTSSCGTYSTNDSILIRSSLIKWYGCGQDAGTSIAVASTTAHCVKIGPASYTSGNPGTFINDPYVFDITCSRAATPIMPPSNVISNGPAGFYIAGVIRAQLYRTQAYNDLMGYYEIDTINTLFSKTGANRAALNTPPVTFTNGSASISLTNTFAAGQLVIFSTTGSLPTNFAASTSYYVISTGLSGSTFQVSATSGGSAIVAGSAGSGTQTVSGDAFVGWYADGVGPNPTISHTATFTNSSASIGWTAHGMIANQTVKFTTTGGLPTNFTAGTFYYVSATGLTANAFQVSATPGGASITAGSAGTGTQTGTTASCFSGCFSLNASTYFDTPTTSVSGLLPYSIGAYFPGSFSDLSILWFGSSSLLNGIVFQGPTALGLPQTRTVIDAQIIQPQIDGVPPGGTGISINGTNPYGGITVIGGYSAFSGGSANASLIALNNTRGLTIKGGFQFIGYTSTSSTSTCLNIQSSAQINIDGLWQDCYNPVVIGGSNPSGIDIEGSIFNSSQAAGLTAITMSGTATYNKIHVGIDSLIAGQFANGITLDATSINNTIDVTKITSQVTNKANINGTIPTADGYSIQSTDVRGYGSNAVQSFPTLTTTTGGTLQFGGAATTGVYTDGTNVAIRGYGSGPVYIQSSVASGLTYGTFSSNGLGVNSSDTITAGGSVGIAFKTVATGIYIGLGAPTVSGSMGSIYLRSDGTPSYNTNGSTGWNTLLVTGGALGTPSSGVGTNITGVNAATLGGATFASPGAIGGTTAAPGTFTTVNATTAGTGYSISGVSRLFNYATSYTAIADTAGVTAAAFNAGNNLFYSTAHIFQSSGGGTTFGTWDATKLMVGSALPPTTGKVSSVPAVNGCSFAGSDNVTNSFYVCHIAGGPVLLGSDGTAGISLGYGSTSGTRVAVIDQSGFNQAVGTTQTKGYTVATLPSTAGAGKVTGARAHVTDAVACTFLGALTGSGSTFCPVVYNGSAWVGN